MTHPISHCIPLNHIPIGVMVVSRYGQILSANSECEELFGYSAEALTALRLQEFTHPEDLEKEVIQTYQALRGHRNRFTLRKRFLRRDGKTLYAIVNAELVDPDILGKDARFTVTVQDATDVFRNVESLGLNSQKINALTEYLDEMVWIATPDLSKVLFVNSRFESIWERPVRVAYEDFNQILRRVHSDDLSRITKAITLPGKEKWDIHYRLDFGDGKIKFLRDHGQVIKDDFGEPLYLVGSTSDVTREHKREQELRRVTKELESANRALRERVNRDALTGVLSRIGIIDVINAAYLLFQRTQHVSSLIFIDLNSFKSVNDDYGHEAGDQVLIAITESLKEIIRETDAIGRYGGDEFLVYLPYTDLQGAQHVADKIKELAVSVQYESEQLPAISVSLGLAEISNDLPNPDAWVRRADAAMYRYKSHIKNENREKSLLNTFHSEDFE